MEGIYLQRNWDKKYENIAISEAIAVDKYGYQQVLGSTKGMKLDKGKNGWANSFQWLYRRSLDKAKLVIGSKYFGILLAVGKEFLVAKYQQCNSILS